MPAPSEATTWREAGKKGTPLAGALSRNDDIDRLEEDFQIRPQVECTDVLKIVVELLAEPFICICIPEFNLRQPGDTWLCLQTKLKLRQILLNATNEIGAFRTGTDDAHLAFENVDELWQFVNSGPAEKASQRRDARILFLSPDRLPGFSVHDHRAELVDRKGAAKINQHTSVTTAAINADGILICTTTAIPTATIKPDSFLTEEYRPA